MFKAARRLHFVVVTAWYWLYAMNPWYYAWHVQVILHDYQGGPLGDYLWQPYLIQGTIYGSHTWFGGNFERTISGMKEIFILTSVQAGM